MRKRLSESEENTVTEEKKEQKKKFILGEGGIDASMWPGGDARRRNKKGEGKKSTATALKQTSSRKRKTSVSEEATPFDVQTEPQTKPKYVPLVQRAAVVLAGNRNAGKSSLMNRLCGQEVSIVSKKAGTTTDAVQKAVELTPGGPVVFYDTAGIDDEKGIGQKRVRAAEKVLFRADIIIMVIGQEGITKNLEARLHKMHTSGQPFILVFNFADEVELSPFSRAVCQLYNGIAVSAKTGAGIDKLKERLASLLRPFNSDSKLLEGLVKKDDTVVLVAPIDDAAPEGRLILPQVRVLREVLDLHAKAVVCQPDELRDVLGELLEPPALVITDSQAVARVYYTVPEDVPMTTFSILFARAKGNYDQMLKGAYTLLTLPAGAHILIAEGCSHHVTCNDIGRKKLPQLIMETLNRKFRFSFVAGHHFPHRHKKFDLVIHCGACMLGRGEMRQRLLDCMGQEVPVTNYGMVLAQMEGILERVQL